MQERFCGTFSFAEFARMIEGQIEKWLKQKETIMRCWA